jgi:hypothetical protein
MLSQSKTVPAKELEDFGYPSSSDNVVIFTGTYNQIAIELKMSSGMRNKAAGVLKSVRAVTLIRSGGPHTKSIYILNYEPTVEMLETHKTENYLQSKKIMPTQTDQILATLASIQARLEELEKRLDRHNIR